MKTAQELLNYITDNNLAKSIDSTDAKSLEAISSSLQSDEEVCIVFNGIVLSQSATFVYAFTNKRLIFAGQNWGQRTLKTVLLENVNDISKSISITKTCLNLDFYKENIETMPFGNIDEIYNILIEFLADYKNWKETKIHSSQNLNADELIKYKKLLDEGIITAEEFEIKKQEVLDNKPISNLVFQPSKKYYTKSYYAAKANGNIRERLDINSEKSKLSIGTKVVIWVIALTVLLVIVIVSASQCSPNNGVGNYGQATTNQIQSVESPNYSCTYTKGLGYHVTITGALKNVTKSTFSYVSITFTLYDDNGYNIGTAMANMNYLGAGEIWKFEANSLTWFDSPPANCKCTDITCF